LQLGKPLENVLAGAVNCASFRGELEPPPVHLEQRHPQALAQALHLEGNGRLREAHFISRMRDASEPGNGLEHGDLCERAASIQPAEPGVPHAAFLSASA
jgi:hypothetical protein